VSNFRKSLNKTTGMRVTLSVYLLWLLLCPAFPLRFEVYLFVVSRKSPYPKASSLYNYTWNISISTLLISMRKFHKVTKLTAPLKNIYMKTYTNFARTTEGH